MTDPTVFRTDRVLNDSSRLPAIGQGSARSTDPGEAMVSALRLGYRLLDTASAYGTEATVPRAIAASGVPRGDVTVMTKLRGRDQGYGSALRAAAESRERLGGDPIDVYLIHWPMPAVDRYVETWRAMIELRAAGVVRTIGVSNFTADQLRRLGDETGTLPAVNQIELHPIFPQPELRAFHEAHGIQTVAYSPLARGGEVLESAVIVRIAARLGITPAQVIVRWHRQHGVVPILGSGNPVRQRLGLEVWDFVLSESDMAAIDSAFDPRRLGGDPLTREEL
ncbi:MAG: aldo/keto reductase [Microbacterium sp.]|uniref:aldo/keto reductase n=1 Tax=Microbacterium sp. TaxID=51671 RepID=UPI0039E634B0